MFKVQEIQKPSLDYCFYDEDAIFYLGIERDGDFIGTISVHKHPYDKNGGQVGLEVEKRWRKKWLTKDLAASMLSELIKTSKKHNLTILYSVALSQISPRMLVFFGFLEYYLKKPKTYYYLDLRG
jgi:hypothetical protein